MAALHWAGGLGLSNCVNQVWEPHNKVVQLWAVPRHYLQRATAAPKAVCGGSLHDHCHCARLPAEFWGVSRCQSRTWVALCLESCYHVRFYSLYVHWVIMTLPLSGCTATTRHDMVLYAYWTVVLLEYCRGLLIISQEREHSFAAQIKLLPIDNAG